MSTQVLSQNIDCLFTFQFDPLKVVLSDIVRQIQEQREIIEKIRGDQSYNDIVQMEGEEFEDQNNYMQNQDIGFDAESLSAHDRTKTDNEEDKNEQKEILSILNNQAGKHNQNLFLIDEDQNEQNIIKDEGQDKAQQNLDPNQMKERGLIVQAERDQRNSMQNLSSYQNKNVNFSTSMNKKSQKHNSQSVNIQDSKNSIVGQGNQYSGLTKKHPIILEILNKLDLLDSKMSQKEHLQRQENLVLKQEIDDKINDQINQLWTSLKQMQNKINQNEEASILAKFSSTQSSSQKEGPDNIKGENNQELLQAIQGILNKQRKDFQEKVNSQLQFLENKVKHEMTSLQNFVQLCTSQQDDEKVMNDNSLGIGYDSNRHHIQIENQKSFDEKTNKTTLELGDRTGKHDELAIPSPSNQRRMTVAHHPDSHVMKIPPKILNEIRFLKTNVDKHDKLITEIGEKVYLNDRVLSRINDYYENNLRNVQVKSYGEAIKELEKLLETRASNLEVKKVIASIHECNDKFDWLEERYKEERKSQSAITTSLQSNLKKSRQRIDSMEQKDTYMEKMLQQIKDELKEKFRGEHNWMGNYGGQNNNEMMRMQFDSQDENLKQFEKKIEAFQKMMEQSRQEDKALYRKLQDSIETKVGIQKLQETEEKTEQLIDKVIHSMNKRFLEKKEIKRQYGNLDKQMNYLYELFMSRMNDIEASDPMIAKRPICGWSCLNCSKSLSNFHGTLADYQINKKFPNRDPSIRMAKAQGFSKIFNQQPNQNFSDDEQKFKSQQKSKIHIKSTSLLKVDNELPSSIVQEDFQSNRMQLEDQTPKQQSKLDIDPLSKRSSLGLPQLKQK